MAGNFSLHCGRAEDILGKFEADTFDACFCDPPYGLEFMGHAWDKGVPPASVWAEVGRVLKPGAYLFAFGGTRTFHRLACAIEDAGFELFDCGCWLHAQGFPKGLDISKAIDKAAGAEREVLSTRTEHNICRPEGGGDERLMTSGGARETREVQTTAPATSEAALWSGYNVALKPAWEPVIMARKPCEKTYAANCLKYGCGGLNVDGCRIGDFVNTTPDGFDRYNKSLAEQGYRPNEYQRGRDGEPSSDKRYAGKGGTSFSMLPGPRGGSSAGRWPANVVLDEAAAAQLDAEVGTLTSGANPTRRGSDKFRETYSAFEGQRECIAHRGADEGGPSRFFYTAKADPSERTLMEFTSQRIKHPTMKPLDLTTYFAKMLLPPKRNTPRKLIVPFSGVASEMIGAIRAGWEHVTGIEMDPTWCDLARRRILADAPLLNREDVDGR